MHNTRMMNSKLFLYGLADMPVMIAIMPMALYLNKFYATDMGLDLADLANILLFARLFDLITDPLVGYLSDHTQTRWGRRRPWMLASLPFLMMGIYKVFMPEGEVDIWYLFTWIMVMWLGWTMLIIPYYAWGAELSDDYDERTRITGWRAGMGAFGSLLSIAIPAVAVLWFSLDGIAGIMRLTGIAALVMVPVAVIVTVCSVDEKRDFAAPALQLVDGLKIMVKNGLFRWLILAFAISSVGLSVILPLNAFYVTAVLQVPESSIPLLMVFNFAAGVLAIPFWVMLSKRIGKHFAWIGGFAVVGIVSPAYLFMGPGDFYNIIPVFVIAAIGTGAFTALPNSMKADVIDIDTARTGENRAAMFFSAWSLTSKFASSLGGWLGLQALALIDFNAARGLTNSPEAIEALKYVYVFLPLGIFVLAGIVIWKYPLNRARQQRIRAAIDRRDRRRATALVTNPDRVN